MTTHQRILDANPELKELSFGCQFRKDGLLMYVTDILFYGADKKNWMKVAYANYKHPTLAYMTEPVEIPTAQIYDSHSMALALLKADEILGHPIQLQHVIKAIKQSSKCDTYWEYAAVSDLIWGDYAWNLSLSWDNQEQPVKDFVGSLLDN